jgi:hypothetical protein
LLRELARALQRRGRATRFVGRGDLLAEVDADGIVLVDEAGWMSATALERVVRSGTAVLADLPGFEARLEEQAAGITVVRLDPLQPDEVAAFLADRLARAGQASDLLSADAVEVLALHSAGVPRVLNLLTRAALFMAANEGAAQLEREHVDLAVALREGEMPEAGALASAVGAPSSRRAMDGTAGENVPASAAITVTQPVSAVPVSSAGPVTLRRSKARRRLSRAALLVAALACAAALIGLRPFAPGLILGARATLARAAARLLPTQEMLEGLVGLVSRGGGNDHGD